MKRYLEYRGEDPSRKTAESAKFWQVLQSGSNLEIQYGRIGSIGKSITKSFETSQKAQQELEKLVAEKLKKGYLEITTKNQRGGSEHNSSSETQQCPSCKSTIRGGKFCSECGQPVSNNSISLTGNLATDSPASNFSDWVKRDTQKDWADFLSSLTKSGSKYFAQEIGELQKALKKYKIGTRVYSAQAPQDVRAIDNLPIENILQIRLIENDNTYYSNGVDGSQVFGHITAYITPDANHDRDEDTVGYLVSEKPISEDDLIYPDAAIAIHCPRCYALLVAEDEDSDWPDEDQFPDCPACFGATPIWIDLLGGLSPLLRR